MRMSIETDLVDERSLFHRKLNLVDVAKIRVRYLVVLDDKVAEGHKLVVWRRR